ncbi:PREDICTED: F-box/LRR-repeat protein At3g48880-like isoform X1 [Nelumbo nucifera]|uniref:F-box/LRR-repeat protein At3g48880-like isoform X1 n=1 Tax=Nelumbo nucifera TaxID=4432 RepID=A0A1U8B6S9_NELNU|nr:PREDICTED: F-box/LRR-repeat protein At3g48880-like isoform X1 [Nelumbo nucifera]
MEGILGNTRTVEKETNWEERERKTQKGMEESHGKAVVIEEERKWEEMNKDCLVKVFEVVGLESLILDVPFVCKSWYNASLDPQCWKNLTFPKLGGWPSSPFMERYMDEYHADKFSVTGFIKFVVDRSCKSSVKLVLPGCCSLEAFAYVSNECPSLQVIGLPSELVVSGENHILEFVSKWSELRYLYLGTILNCFKEILTQISLNCKNFSGLGTKGYIDNEAALAIATQLPKIKYLHLKNSSLPRESLVTILEGCKELVELDVRNCIGFEADDEEILMLASHIKRFKPEGSEIYEDWWFDEHISSRDVDSDAGSD